MAEHEYWMRLALAEAQKAAAENEVPVGAAVVADGRLVALGRNDRERTQDPLGHAEIRALSAAAAEIGFWRLEGCSLYVTLEPCIMCSGAMLQARIDRVIFGARDPKAGAIRSLYELASDARLNHRIEVVEGVLENECSEILKAFFKKMRK